MRSRVVALLLSGGSAVRLPDPPPPFFVFTDNLKKITSTINSLSGSTEKKTSSSSKKKKKTHRPRKLTKSEFFVFFSEIYVASFREELRSTGYHFLSSCRRSFRMHPLPLYHSRGRDGHKASSSCGRPMPLSISPCCPSEVPHNCLSTVRTTRMKFKNPEILTAPHRTAPYEDPATNTRQQKKKRTAVRFFTVKSEKPFF